MLVRYRLYRSKYPDVVFNSETIKFVIENDDHLVALDDILTRILSYHIQNLPEIKKFGIAYVQRMEIEFMEITDEDNVNLDEQSFRHYMSTINPNLRIVWSKTTNNTNKQQKSVTTSPRGVYGDDITNRDIKRPYIDISKEVKDE